MATGLAAASLSRLRWDSRPMRVSPQPLNMQSPVCLSGECVGHARSQRVVVVFRNDDVSAVSDVGHERRVAEVFDHYGVIQTLGVVPRTCPFSEYRQPKERWSSRCGQVRLWWSLCASMLSALRARLRCTGTRIAPIERAYRAAGNLRNSVGCRSRSNAR